MKQPVESLLLQQYCVMLLVREDLEICCLTVCAVPPLCIRSVMNITQSAADQLLLA